MKFLCRLKDGVDIVLFHSLATVCFFLFFVAAGTEEVVGHILCQAFSKLCCVHVPRSPDCIHEFKNFKGCSVQIVRLTFSSFGSLHLINAFQEPMLFFSWKMYAYITKSKSQVICHCMGIWGNIPCPRLHVVCGRLAVI